MTLLFDLAMRDLWRQRIHLICNVAILAGVLVPLMVVFGVKNGVYDALIGELINDPGTLRIETTGNSAFTQADVDEVRGWAETGFATAKTRSVFDFVNVRLAGVNKKRDAILVPSGTGDPTLPKDLALGPQEAVVSANLARQLDISEGNDIQIFTQATERPRQLMLPLTVVAVLPDARLSGRSILADIAVLDLVEAFYDEYALPDHGITEGSDIATRSPEFEGMRIFARELTTLAALQSRLETRFGVQTEARTGEVSGILNLGQNLNLALLLTAGVASLGLSAALLFGFWGEVARKRQTLAALALLGIGPERLWIFPVLQALVSGVIGLVVSFMLFFVAGAIAEQMFNSALTAEGGLVVLTVLQGLAITAVTLGFVAAASFFAARSAAQVDPADVLREGAT
ncbi:ABC transporter permease [Tateyamaria sp.]|uniref:ABC transporter permease n=1 Tax=Tateyamaria sp. TaxID=1929288 RepID=UPI003B22850A